MTGLDQVSVGSVVRNLTKINTAATLIMNITAPPYSDKMVISFPHTQVYTGPTCSVMVAGVAKSCTVLNSHMIMTENIPGSASYEITGMYNQVAFDPASTSQTVNVTIGYPYARATTTPSTSSTITPQLTLGSITVNSVVSSN